MQRPSATRIGLHAHCARRSSLTVVASPRAAGADVVFNIADLSEEDWEFRPRRMLPYWLRASEMRCKDLYTTQSCSAGSTGSRRGHPGSTVRLDDAQLGCWRMLKQGWPGRGADSRSQSPIHWLQGTRVNQPVGGKPVPTIKLFRIKRYSRLKAAGDCRPFISSGRTATDTLKSSHRTGEQRRIQVDASLFAFPARAGKDSRLMPRAFFVPCEAGKDSRLMPRAFCVPCEAGEGFQAGASRFLRSLRSGGRVPG